MTSCRGRDRPPGPTPARLPSPLRQEVPQLAYPAPEGEALADGARDIGLGIAHGLAERPPLGEARRDGRRQGAARTVGVVGLDARDLVRREVAAVEEQVDRVALEVTALDQDVTRPESVDAPRRLFHLR